MNGRHATYSISSLPVALARRHCQSGADPQFLA